MEYDEKIRACVSLKELFVLWENKLPQVVTYKIKGAEHNVTIDHANNKFISDGIVNSAVWNSGQHKRILYVLKEAYTGDDEGFDLAEWLSTSPDYRMWNRVARWTYGIQNTTVDRIQKYIADSEEEIYKRCFNQISVMNLKKSSGESGSVYEEIDAYATADKEELKKEFELIDPDIVVCGSTFGTLINKVFETSVDKANDNWAYYMEIAGKERLFIDYYHPANHWPDLVNYYAVVNLYQQALIEKAGI